MGKLSKLILPAGFLKMMKSKKNRKNGSSKKDQSEEKLCDRYVEENRNVRFKKTEHFAESSKSSNDEKSKPIYKLERSELEAIVSYLKSFNELLSGRNLDKKKVIQDYAKAKMDVESLPLKSELLDSGEVFLELEFDVREEIRSALKAIFDLQKYFFEEIGWDRWKRIARNNCLVEILLKLPVCASKCEDGASNAELSEFINAVARLILGREGPAEIEQADLTADLIVELSKRRVIKMPKDDCEPFAMNHMFPRVTNGY